LQNSKSPLTEQFVRWRVWNSWPEVVGEEIAKHTLPVSFFKGTLYLHVNSAARMQELTFMLEHLIARINQFSNMRWVKFIRLTLDRRSVPKPEEMSPELRKFISERGES
jgi:predicted nucleic acid-binding Zn ribbon protein